MANIKIINIAATDCRPEVEEAWNRWYNETHAPMLFKFPGMKKASRYKRIGGDEKLPRYIAIYEFEDEETLDKYMTSPERTAAVEDAQKTWKEEDFWVTGVARYEKIKSWEK